MEGERGGAHRLWRLKDPFSLPQKVNSSSLTKNLPPRPSASLQHNTRRAGRPLSHLSPCVHNIVASGRPDLAPPKRHERLKGTAVADGTPKIPTRPSQNHVLIRQQVSRHSPRKACVDVRGRRRGIASQGAFTLLLSSLESGRPDARNFGRLVSLAVVIFF